MPAKQIVSINIDHLSFDKENPRLVEFNLPKDASEKHLIELLYDVMAVEEIILSMVNSGFFANEPLIAIKGTDEDSYVVIEGNRRLAAAKIIRNFEKYQEFYPKSVPPPTKELLEEFNELPVIIEDSRKDAWQFIGFKHVNGAAKWNSFAKAQYIAQVRNEFNVPLEQISLQIGDTNKTVQRLYQSLMVIEQAEQNKIFDRTDVNAPRLYFSHLYTGLQYDGIRNFVDLKDISEETTEPVPKEKLDELKILLTWIFGSKKFEIKPVIQSQNPDLRNLDAVVHSQEAISALKSTSDLSIAFEISQPDDFKFTESLNEAKRALYKSLQYYVTGYKGDEDSLRTAGTIATMADKLYEGMEKKSNEIAGVSKKQRLTE